MLCYVCSNIHFDHIENCELIRREPDRLQADSGLHLSSCVFYFHHKDKWTLKRSADQGCHFCGMLWLNLFERGTRMARLSSPYGFARGEVILRRAIVERWVEQDAGVEQWNRKDWIYVQCEEANATTSSTLEYPGVVGTMLEALTTCGVDSPKPSEDTLNRNSPDGDEEEPQVLPVHLLPAQNPRVYSPWLDVSTMSPASLALAYFWLNNCLKFHQPCQKSRLRSTLPSRIIDVSDPNHPLLVNGGGRNCPYVTLSYKWGNLHKYVTTEQVLSKHQKEIPLQVLPWTFKDAIHVTHVLGFRWLWIDALCIIQDSKEDKEDEIGRMDQTFRCSTLTLFAAAGSDANAGLSASRDPRGVKPCRLNLKTTLGGETVEGISYVTLDRQQAPAPLFDRGWVLQEQVLATRGLLFGSDQLTWRCLCGSSDESRPAPVGRIERVEELGELQGNTWRSYSPGWDGFDKLRMWLMRRDAMPDRPQWKRDNQFDSWYSLVSHYSRRSLTYSSDILPALSGLATAMAKTHGCTYTAGLWLEDLQIGLTWYVVDGGADGIDMDDDSPHAPKGLDMPTWTWARQWGKAIAFRTWYEECILVTHEGVEFADISHRDLVYSSYTFAAVTNRSLTVTGRLRTALLSPMHVELLDQEKGRWVSNIKDPITNETVGQIAFDSHPSSLSLQVVHCLLCSVKKRDEKWHLTCLGLSPTGRSGEEYSRIGLVFIQRTGWFGHLDMFRHGERPKDAKTIRLV